MKNYLFLFCIFLSTVCRGQNTANGKLATLQPSITIRVPQSPAPVAIGGKTNLVYELFLTNFSNKYVVIKRIEVLDAADSAVVLACEGEDLNNRFSTPGTKSDSATFCVMEPGSFALVYVELLAATKKLPRELVHRVTVAAQENSPNERQVVQGASTPLTDKPAAVFGAPLANGTWAAVYSPAWSRGHRRVVFTVDGVARIPGRFAIDFIKLDENGQFAVGDEDVITNWQGYGADVLAVADGVVATVRQDFPESPRLSVHPAYPAESATGNYISLKIAENQYVFYEHLKPGTIRVKSGQIVKKGDTLAQLGFTGQSTGPHLHLHLADADSPLGAEGLPYVFDQFTVLGFYPDFGAFGKSRWQATTRKARTTNQRPASNHVIQFN